MVREAARLRRRAADGRTIRAAAVNRITQAVDVKADGDEVAAEAADRLRAQRLPPKAAAGINSLGPKLD